MNRINGFDKILSWYINIKNIGVDMIKGLSNCIAEYIYRCGFVDKDYEEICAYGLELIFSSIIDKYAYIRFYYNSKL